MSSDGEVAIRQNGHEHAVAAPRLDGQLHVDLDHVEVPRLKLPSEIVVEYHGDVDDNADELETDGGTTVDRTSVEMRGDETINEELAMWALIASGFLLVSAGYLFGIESTISGLIAGAGGVLLAFITGPSYWSDRS